MPLYNGSGSSGGSSTPTFIPGSISGFVLSNNSGSPNTKVDVSAGTAIDSTNAAYLAMGSALTKDLSASWAVGTGNGGLDAGSKANSTWYHVWAILKDSDLSVDALFSTSASAPTMPSGYTKKRLVGSVLTNSSGNIIAFSQTEIAGGGTHTYWKARPVDVDILNTLGTTERTDTLSVPTGYRVKAALLIISADGGGASKIWVRSPDITALTTSSPTQLSFTTLASGVISAAYSVMTNTAAQVTSLANVNTIDEYAIITEGWEWGRR